jgi:hypothetical protein
MNLDEIRARAEAATPGPWHLDGRSICADVEISHDGPVDGKWRKTVACSVGAWLSGRPTDTDAEFIAHAREDVPALLALVESLTAENARLRSREVSGLASPEVGHARVDVDMLRELAGALNRMHAKRPLANYTGFGDAILKAIGEEPGYMGQPLTIVDGAS